MSYYEEYLLSIGIALGAIGFVALCYVILYYTLLRKHLKKLTPARVICVVFLLGIVAISLIGMQHYKRRVEHERETMHSDNSANVLRIPEEKKAYAESTNGGTENQWISCEDEQWYNGYYINGVREDKLVGFNKVEVVEREDFRFTRYVRIRKSYNFPDTLIKVEYIGLNPEMKELEKYVITWFEGDEAVAWTESIDPLEGRNFVVLIKYSKRITSLEVMVSVPNTDGNTVEERYSFAR